MKRAFLTLIFLTLCFCFTGCDKENSDLQTKDISTTSVSVTQTKDISTASVSVNQNPKTLDDAVKWYLQEVASHGYVKGEHFASSYRILDTEESSNDITVYAHVLCETVSLDGTPVSGSAGLTVITFKKINNTFEYEKATPYDPQQIAVATEIPKKVKDDLENASFFEAMRAEVDKDIADFVASAQ